MPTKPSYFKPRHRPTITADAERGSATARGYDSEWRKVRNAHLASNPLCFLCLKRKRTRAATVVDHRVPVAVDPSRRLDPTNLRSCCVDCHAEITGNYKRTGVNEPSLPLGGWAP